MEVLLNLPKYCDVYKFQLIEELTVVSPIHYHFGKCLVIGKLSLENDSYYLNNIQLKCVDKEYQIPTGTEKLLLLPMEKINNLIDGALVEVHGEAVFWQRTMDWNNRDGLLPKTVKDFIVDLRKEHLQFNETDSQMFLDQDTVPADRCQLNEMISLEASCKLFQNNWMPAIQLYTMNIIDDAENLFDVHLRMRLLLRKRCQIPGDSINN